MYPTFVFYYYFCIIFFLLETQRGNMGNCAVTWTEDVAESDRQKAWE